MKKKSYTAIVAMCIAGFLMSGCGANEPAEVTDNQNEPVIDAVIEEEPEETPEPETTDFSYLYGAATPVTFDMNISDNGSGYLFKVNTVEYDLAVGFDAYQIFRENAVGTDYEMHEDGSSVNSLTDKTELECLGETFTLTSYKKNSMGRGFCEFAGEDGETYTIINDISPQIEMFTEMTYLSILSSDHSVVTRKISFEEPADLLIPYDTKVSEMLETYIDNPAGVYKLQFDGDGNLIKIAD